MKEIYLIFIRIYALHFISLINFFQQECNPVFPFIETRIQQLHIFLENGIADSSNDFFHEWAIYRNFD